MSAAKRGRKMRMKQRRLRREAAIARANEIFDQFVASGFADMDTDGDRLQIQLTKED